MTVYFKKWLTEAVTGVEILPLSWTTVKTQPLETAANNAPAQSVIDIIIWCSGKQDICNGHT